MCAYTHIQYNSAYIQLSQLIVGFVLEFIHNCNSVMLLQINRNFNTVYVDWNFAISKGTTLGERHELSRWWPQRGQCFEAFHQDSQMSMASAASPVAGSGTCIDVRWPLQCCGPLLTVWLGGAAQRARLLRPRCDQIPEVDTAWSLGWRLFICTTRTTISFLATASTATSHHLLLLLENWTLASYHLYRRQVFFSKRVFHSSLVECVPIATKTASTYWPRLAHRQSEDKKNDGSFKRCTQRFDLDSQVHEMQLWSHPEWSSFFVFSDFNIGQNLAWPVPLSHPFTLPWVPVV